MNPAPYSPLPPRRGPGPVQLVAIGCGGLIALWIIVVVIGAIVAMNSGAPPAAATRGGGYATKATYDERDAAKRSNGFGQDEARLYHLGLQHIRNAHQNPHSFTIGQVIDQERGRERQRRAIADAHAARARAAEEHRQYELTHHDYCADASNDEHAAAAAGISDRAQYRYAVAGLAANEKCTDDSAHLVNEAYLLSMKAMAEHAVGGDWRTDFNQANTLLVQCQTKPGLYGTRTGAHCETQEGYNIRAATQWEMDSYR